MHVTTSRLRRAVRRAPSHTLALVEGAAFWVAAVLPFSYPPLFVVIERTALGPELVAALVVANAVALLVGHRYDPARRERGRSDREGGR